MSEVKVNKISPRTNCGTVTLGDSGDTFSIPAGVTLTNSGTATGFGPTGAVSWNTTKITADPNPAVSGVGYFADTTSAAFTVTLPAAPSAGDIVALSDYTGTWETNNLTVGRNGSNINGAASDLILNADNTTATLIYVDGTEGWRVIDTGSLSEVNVQLYVAATGGTITTCGDYKTHIFTGPGTFTVTCAGNSQGSNSVDYLVVAGGGGGGSATVNNGSTGGGGAGGLRTSTAFPVTATTFPITIGGGGAGGPITQFASFGANGVDSVFSTITSAGGGGGGGSWSAPTCGKSGGSGGGGANLAPGGSGNTPPTSPPQGNPGGDAATPNSTVGGGGGGATAAGTTGTPTQAGNGGTGTDVTPIFGPGLPNSGVYAGGGGGGVYGPAGQPLVGAGGPGGGGAGGPVPARTGNPGTINTGGGAGGGSPSPSNDASGGAGGSGIVIIRYKYQ